MTVFYIIYPYYFAVERFKYIDLPLPIGKTEGAKACLQTSRKNIRWKSIWSWINTP
jgi:hypothetical protein